MQRIAVISAHTSPLAPLGYRETGGMNVYVRELSREMGRRGYLIDVFTRRAEPDGPDVVQAGPNVRVIHLRAGPEGIEGRRAPLRPPARLRGRPARLPARRGHRPTTSFTATTGSPASLGLRLRERWGVPLVACSTPSAS